MRRPRNRSAYECSQARRSAIRAVLLAHSPLARPLTARQIRERAALPISEDAVRWHMRAIRSGE
jgi:hypothetical protein